MAKPKKPAKGSRAARKPKQASEGAESKVEKRTGSPQYKLPEGPRIEHHISNIEAWDTKLADMKAHVKKAYQAAAAEGISKKLLGQLIDLKNGDPIVARQHLESYGIGLKVIGAPFQLNVFDTMYEDDIAQARAEATVAARGGKSPECRFAEGSPAAEAYLETYRKIQASMVPGADKLTEGEIDGALKTVGESSDPPREIWDEQADKVVADGRAAAKGPRLVENVH